MGKYKYILWDLDGTLANTYEGISKCIDYALKPFGVKIETTEDYKKFMGPPFRYSLRKYLGFNAQESEDFIRLYRERYIPIGAYECEIFPDAGDAVREFREAGLYQAVTTSKPETQAETIVGKFGLTDVFDDICGATLDGKIDTKIQVLNEEFRRIEAKDPDFDKAQAILIGDTIYDAEGSKEAGIDFAGVSYGFGTREDLEASGALAIVDDPLELRDIIL